MIKCLLSRPGLIAGPLHSTPLPNNSQLIPRLDPIDSKSSFVLLLIIARSINTFSEELYDLYPLESTTLSHNYEWFAPADCCSQPRKYIRKAPLCNLNEWNASSISPSEKTTSHPWFPPTDLLLLIDKVLFRFLVKKSNVSFIFFDNGEKCWSRDNIKCLITFHPVT